MLFSYTNQRHRVITLTFTARPYLVEPCESATDRFLRAGPRVSSASFDVSSNNYNATSLSLSLSRQISSPFPGFFLSFLAFLFRCFLLPGICPPEVACGSGLPTRIQCGKRAIEEQQVECRAYWTALRSSLAR